VDAGLPAPVRPDLPTDERFVVLGESNAQHQAALAGLERAEKRILARLREAVATHTALASHWNVLSEVDALVPKESFLAMAQMAAREAEACRTLLAAQEVLVDDVHELLLYAGAARRCLCSLGGRQAALGELGSRILRERAALQQCSAAGDSDATARVARDLIASLETERDEMAVALDHAARSVLAEVEAVHGRLATRLQSCLETSGRELAAFRAHCRAK
jgi:hypothetical protein